MKFLEEPMTKELTEAQKRRLSKTGPEPRGKVLNHTFSNATRNVEAEFKLVAKKLRKKS